MSIYNYEEAFGAWDKTTKPMRQAIARWFKLYYGVENEGADPCQRVAYTVVNKLVKTIFGEYHVTAHAPFVQRTLKQLDAVRSAAVQLALVGGECYLKPYIRNGEFAFALIPRDNILIFGRDPLGLPTDVGTVERTAHDKYYYTLLERRQVDADGYLTIQNQLYRAYSPDKLGTKVALWELPQYGDLPESYRYETPLYSVGLVQLKNPMFNCVDGSADGVSVYAAAEGLIGAIDENEAQLRGEFSRGQSRILASRDLLRDGKTLSDHLFVGLDEDPEQVGITIFSPQLREQSYLARKQEYLRNVESVIGLKRGLLSDANAQDRTATEISSSAGDYNLTVIDFQDMWHQCLEQALQLCIRLADLYQMGPVGDDTFSVDWGNGVLYDEDKTWQIYQDMVTRGLLRPEIALGWRFNMPWQTEAQRAKIRQLYMPTEVVDESTQGVLFS